MDELVIRVARNPREMRALAPADMPPPDYATGVAYSRWGVILLTMSSPQSWEPPDLEVVLVHELSHVALYRAVAGNDVPRWFNEGVAIHQSEARMLPRMESLLRAAAQRSMLRLSELDDHFPNRPHEVNVAYAQSADVVGFLRRSSRANCVSSARYCGSTSLDPVRNCRGSCLVWDCDACRAPA